MKRAWVVSAVIAVASPAMANTESIDVSPPRGTVMPAQSFAGAANHRVTLTVPAWRGLEPALAITYASSARNGWLGIGMTLEGVPSIERVSAKLGAPTYTTTDTYELDGEPMIACVAGSTSPSCLAGGTHTTKHERYARIVKSGTSWVVTSPTGVVDRYTTYAEPVAVLTSRTDTAGNAVAYTYATVTGTTYLASIAYNGTTITFARETRTDVSSIGAGTSLRRIDNRLRSIAIRTDGVLERAYRLTYATGAAVRRSYLASVQEVGGDATVNSAGVVTGGTALPATRFTYHSDLPALTKASMTTFSRTSGATGDETFVADVNGDGRGDAIAIARHTSGGTSVRGTLDIQVHLGRADGTFTPASVRSSTTANARIGWYHDVRTGDVNGDGRADLVFVERSTTYGTSPTGYIDVQIALGTASGGFTFPSSSRLSYTALSAEFDNVLLADFNGDGRADLLAARARPLNSNYSGVSAMVWLSTGTAFGPLFSQTLSGGGVFGGVRVHAGDVNGDGRDDVVVVYRSSSLCNSAGGDIAVANTYLSLGTGTFGARVASTLVSGCDGDSFAGDALVDLNGDGLADLVGDQAFSVYGAVCGDCDSDVKIVANLGNGDGTFNTGLRSIGWSGSGVGIGRFTAGFVDINGDGIADRVAAQGGTSLQLLVSYGRGDGYFDSGYVSQVSMGGSTSWANTGGIGFGDVDGDGRLSIVATYCENLNFRVATLAPATQFGGLLHTTTLPQGGSVQLDYATSSSFTNGYLPFAFPVVSASRLLDGRGQVASTTYSYTGGLYVPAERQFLGFATTRITDPAGEIRDVAYTQHVADPPGTIASVHERTKAGALVRYEATTFARAGNGTTAPYVSNPSRRYAYECNGATTCKSTSRGWTYSAYGAVASEIEYGDDAITGDERTTFRTQVVNTTAFITQLDATVTVRAGAGVATGTQLAHTTLAYDGAASHATAPTRGFLTKRSRWRGGTSYAVEGWGYDTAGNQTSSIDAVGNTTAMTYDARQRLVRVTNPLGHAEARTYDVLGRVATITDANAAVTTHTYDALGRLVRRAGPDGTATAAWTNWGTPTTQFVTTTIDDGSADGLWTRTYVDGRGRTVRVVVEGGITTDTRYGLRGQVEARSAPYLTGATPVWTTTLYDAVGRPRQITEPDGAVTTLTYGNWLVSTTDHRGLVTDRYYDAYAQLAQVVERLPVAQTTTVAYDLLGNRVRVVDAKGNTTTTAYDPLGRRVQSQDPDLGLWEYAYDDAGRLTWQRDARGVAVDVTYDALGRPLQRRTGTTTLAALTYDEVAAGYANLGRLTSFTDPSGATRRDYDAAGRLRKEAKTIAGTTYLVDWSYDVAGRLASIQYPAVSGVREVVTQTYDASGRVASVGPYTTNLAYDARGNLTSASYGNGANLVRTYSPARGWMLGQTVTASGATLDQFAVTRALSGDITARTSASQARDAWQFTYDALGRLVTADNTADNTLDEAFTYDVLGARMSARRGTVTTSYAYPASGAARPHAPTTIGGIAVRYDANGNRLAIGASPDAVYDANNRLVHDGTTAYVYDAEGTRVRAGTKVFVRDLFEADGATSTRYYHLGRERIARRDHTGAVAYYHGDSIGTVRALSSAAGAVAGAKLTFAFGELAQSTGLADAFGLAGQRRDESGLYHMGARMMDPAHGQFTQPDPSGAPDPARPQSLNRYSYVLNNPIRLADPTGFQEEEEKELQPERETAPVVDNGPLRIRILRNTPEGLRWTTGDPPGRALEAPRLFSKSFDEEKRQRPFDPSWAFESRTGRLFGTLNGRAFEDDAYKAVPFWTMGDAIAHIDRAREEGQAFIPTPQGLERYDITRPQYLEGNDGSVYRYNQDSTIDAIQPRDVPSAVGIDQHLYIFLEALSS